MRAFFAVATAIAVCAAAPAFADAQSHVQAAKKAERKGEWRKALEEWKAAYSSDVNAEYLIGIGDAYSHLGNKTEAKKNYEAYLADPLALPANVEKVKTKIAGLDNPGPALALPAGPGLALPAGPGLALPGAEAPPPNLESAPAVAEGKKAKKSKKGDAAPPPLPLPGLDLPSLPLPAAAAAQEPEKKVASNSPALQLPPLPGPSPTAKTAKKEPAGVAAVPGSQVAVASPPPKEHPPVPVAVTASKPPPPSRAEEASGGGKVVAYVAAGAAVVGLGVGVYGFSQFNSAHSELTGSVHDSATAQSLLDKEKSNKTLTFVGLAVGVVAAGVATAVLAF